MKKLKQILKKVNWMAIAQFVVVLGVSLFPAVPQIAHGALVDTFVSQCPADTGVRCGDPSIGGIFRLVISWALAIAFIAAVVMLIIGGFRYITAGGNTEQSGKGKDTIVNALIGIVIIVLSYIIVQIVWRFISGSGGGGVTGP